MRQTNQHSNPLADKFRNYQPTSAKANFEVFEKIEREKNRNWLHLEITILLVSVLVLFAFNIISDIDKLIQTKQGESSLTASPEVINQDASVSNDILSTDRNTAKTSEFQMNTSPVNKQDDISTSTDQTSHDLNDRPNKINDPFPSSEIHTDAQSPAYETPEENRISLVPAEADRVLVTGPVGNSWTPVRFERVSPHLPTELSRTKIVLPELNEIFEDSPFGHEPKSRKRNIALMLSPSVSITAGINQTSQVIRREPGSELYVPAGYNRYLQGASGAAINSWYKVKFEWPVLSTTMASAGIGYNRFSVKGQYSFTVDSFPVYDLDGTIAGYIHLPDTAQGIRIEEKSERSFTYVHLPVGIQTYFPVGKRWLLASGLDISLDYLMQSRGNILNESDYTSVRPLSELTMRKFNLGFNARAGLLYSLTNHWAVGGMVNYDRKLFSDPTNTYYKAYNQGFGFAIHVRYQILK